MKMGILEGFRGKKKKVKEIYKERMGIPLKG